MLTDGEITDFQKTVNEIVKASHLPLSVIIVGVGTNVFEQMNNLDADTKPLFSTNTEKFATRDIVQFVPYQNFSSDPELLTREVLREVPG